MLDSRPRTWAWSYGLRSGAGGKYAHMKSFWKAAVQRLLGERPGALRALAGATAVGAATGAVVYRVLRQQDVDSPD